MTNWQQYTTEVALSQKIDNIIQYWLKYFNWENRNQLELRVQLEQDFDENKHVMPKRLLEAAIAYKHGDYSRALTVLEALPILVTEDPEQNLQWGLLCDLIGLQNEAIDCYLAAFSRYFPAARAFLPDNG